MNVPSILVVDDEPAHVESICDVLGHIGYAMTGRTSAAAAMEAMATQRFDVILADLMMPDMDGISLLRAALAKDPSLVGLIMTGAGTIHSAVEAMKAGALDFVLKPFRISEMMPVIARALKVRRLHLEREALQTRLVERSHQLEVANAGLERMVAIVSHDMRAPLQGIDACMTMLIDQQEIIPSGVPMGEAIRMEARRLVVLATDLIDINRLSSGHMPWHWSEFSPGQLVRDTVAALQPLAEGYRTTLVAEAEFTGCITADSSACRRLLTNLISNAIKHAGATTIQVACRGDAGLLRFIIEDNGKGIDPGCRERLGKPFSSGGETSALGGVGLGLAICLGIAAAHGGAIAIRSRLRQGTRIIVTLRGDLAEPTVLQAPEQFRELDLG
jgi:signal transduction histidine kinase